MPDIVKTIEKLTMIKMELNETCITTKDPKIYRFYEDLISGVKDAIELLKEQQEVIEKYHKADGLFEAHGWKWE